MPNQNEEYLEMVDDCENRDELLSDWERGFCESIREQMENGRALTIRQEETLEKIWDRVTARG